MSKGYKHISFNIIVIGIFSVLQCSCKYDFAEPKGSCDTILPDTVSFTKKIVPIFIANCNSSSCHSGSYPGGNLNLESDKAYAQLMKPGSGYIDTVNPKYSVLYNSIISTANQMPPDYRLNDCDIKIVLKWVEQKAKNN